MFVEVGSAKGCVTSPPPDGLAPKMDIAYQSCLFGSCLNVLGLRPIARTWRLGGRSCSWRSNPLRNV